MNSEHISNYLQKNKLGSSLWVIFWNWETQDNRSVTLVKKLLDSQIRCNIDETPTFDFLRHILEKMHVWTEIYSKTPTLINIYISAYATAPACESIVHFVVGRNEPNYLYVASLEDDVQADEGELISKSSRR